MKHLIFIFAILFTGGILFFSFTKQPENEYIRIHVRANSNQDVDQNIKYLVKDKIVEYLIPHIAQCENRDDFVITINNNLNAMESVANAVLKQNNFYYTANVKFESEKFPTRSYDSVVLESGVYDSIIVELGTASGDNWWCVVYPPLCFVSNNSNLIMYKSKILDILTSILN